MTNEEMNAKAEQIAVRVRDAVAASENAQDIYGLVFVNVKTLIAELTSETLYERLEAASKQALHHLSEHEYGDAETELSVALGLTANDGEHEHGKG
jgi:hypothetical protein